MIRILLVATYAAVRAGLHVLLTDAGDLTIVGDAGGSAELERLLPDLHPDVVLADYNAGDAARLLAVLEGGDAGLVLLGDAPEDYRLLAGCGLRGWAYLLKEAEGPEIAGAVRAAHAGLIALDRSLAPLLNLPDAYGAGERMAADFPADAGLTAREREVLELMARGLSNKLIAARLSISLHTVKFHVAAILAKLGAASRTEAVTLGARLGYVTL